jgi:hypothetical protein
LEGGRTAEFLRGSPVLGVSVIFGTAVMARRTGWRDRGVRDSQRGGRPWRWGGTRG